jgi:hypothetical protein
LKKDVEERIRLTKLKNAVDKIFDNTEDLRDEMSRHLKEYEGKWWNETELGTHDSKVFVNYVFATVMSIAPLLTDNRPTWSLRARKPFLQKMFELYSLCLEYLWDKLDMDKKTFLAVVDAMVMKNGIFKVTFDPDAEVFGEVRVDVIDPRVYFEAPGYDDNWENPFQGTRERRPLSWVRAHFPDKGKDVKADEEEPKGAESWSEKSDEEVMSDFVTVYEVWMRDPETEEVYVTDSEGNREKDEKGKDKKEDREKYPFGKIVSFTRDNLLEEKASPYRHNLPPYVKLYDYYVPHRAIGMGEGDQIEQLNRSINRGMQLMDAFMALSNNPNWLVDENAGIDAETVKTELPSGGNVFSYNSQLNDEPVKRIEMGTLTPDLYNYMSMLPRILEEVTGVTDITKGMASKTERQTAAEVSTLIESSYTRTRQRVRNLEHAIKRVCYLIVDIMQQYYSNIRDFNIKTDQNIDFYKVSNQQSFTNEMMQPKANQEGQVDPQQQKDWEEYKKFIAELGDVDEVYADFDIEIQTNSTLPMDKQSLANLFLRLAQMKIVDPQAVIEQLNIPKGQEIVQRMEQRAQQMMAAKAGGQQRPPKLPGMGLQGKPQNLIQQRLEGI